MLLGAWIDEVYLEIGRCCSIFSDKVGVAVGEEPEVDVVCAEVFDVAERGGEAVKDCGIGGESCSFGDEKRGLRVDGS